jgi:DNA topoisomerase-1
MPDPTRVVAGECSIVHDRDTRSEYRGRVVVVVKPDDTVLVHDADGYQPVAWLTRADEVVLEAGDTYRISARSGDERLRVVAHDEARVLRYPASAAGAPVGACPDCAGTLVRASGAVACTACDARYALPAAASVREETCDCGLPRLRVERGVALDVCLDRACEPLADAVRERFDRAWDCPACGDDLRVIERGGLLLGCDAYPDCEASFSFPAGIAEGTCDCGLPAFETGAGRRCLDSTCAAGPSERDRAPAGGTDGH